MSKMRDLLLQRAPSWFVEGLLHRGEATCRTVLDRCFQAYDRWESHVHAWTMFDREGAIRQADVLDEEILRGTFRGPLHGIPIGVKDIVDVKGLPTSAVASQWSQGAATSDAPIVTKLREAGAVILGKTVTTPYAWTDPPPTRNPWDLNRTPGGSSSGSAVAVATGSAFAAIGTQTGGSIIRPASYCGIIGWKPSRACRPSTEGIVAFSESLDTPGFLVTDLHEIALIQEALGEPIVKSDLSENPPWFETYRADEINPILGIKRFAPRLGRLRGFFEQEADGEMNRMLDHAIDRWRRDGSEVAEVELPPAFGQVRRAHRAVMSFEAARVHRERFSTLPEDYPANMTALLLEGQRVTEPQYREAVAVGEEIAVFLPDGLDAFVMPATTGPIPCRETTGDPIFNSPWTFGGQPVVSFPIGRSQDGMPLCAQFVGMPSREGDLLASASWCFRQSIEMGWRPPTWLLRPPRSA